MAESEVLASASVEIHPYLSPAFSAQLMAQMNGAGMSSAGRRAGEGFLAGMAGALKGGGAAMTSAGNLLTAKITAPALAAGAAVGGIFLAKGWERLTAIDTAESKLKGLGYSAESIEGIMGSALASVKGTAYGLGDAAGAAVSALAAGVAEGDDLTRVLATIGDTATIAGGDYQGVASVFNKVMSKGKMQADEMLQLSERGVPVLQTLADYLGKTAEEVTEMTSAGEIDFATFEAAMRGAFGGAALASGESMTGTIDNLWAAVGRVGAAFLDTGDDGEGFFGRLKPLLGEATEGIDGFCDIASEGGAMLADGLVEGVEAVRELSETAQEMWGNLSPEQQGQLKALAGIALAAGPALKVVGPLASGVGGVFGAMRSGVGAVRSFQGQMAVMATAARNGKGAMTGLPAAIGGIASGSRAASTMVLGLSKTLSFAAGAVPLLAAGFAAFEVGSFVYGLWYAQTEAGKLESKMGELAQGHRSMVDAFSEGASRVSSDGLLGESGRTVEQLAATVDEGEAAIVEIIRGANEEKRALRQEEIDAINGHNEAIAAAYGEQAAAHVAALQSEAQVAPEVMRGMSAEEVAAWVGGIKERGDQALAMEEENFARQRDQLAAQHAQGITDEQQYSAALLAAKAEHGQRVEEIEAAIGQAQSAGALQTAANASEVVAAYGRMTQGLGEFREMQLTADGHVVYSNQVLRDNAHITKQQFLEAWAAMPEGAAQAAAGILEAAGQAAAAEGQLDASTRSAVEAILINFDGLKGGAADVGRDALLEMVNSLGDPSAVTGGLNLAEASCQEIVDAIRANLDLETPTRESVERYVASIEAGGPMAAGAAEEMAIQATAPMLDVPEAFASSGEMAGLGFVGGMEKYISEAAAMAFRMAQAAKNSLNAGLEVHSPSRATRRTGRFFVEGFAGGIDDYAPMAARSAASLAATSAAALSAPAPAAPVPAASAAGALAGDEAVACLRFLADNLYSALSVSLDGRAVSRSVDERQGRLAALRARKGA
ncbi:tape measure protein [Adlercreutzia mucosicola]|uniref:tape measure protein n=2 Tax=Adlercreutzia mucosicola TaxID=580026 RepID=UPI0003F4FE21|nr:tape measure protein [Adlercreutzia mucosicola]